MIGRSKETHNVGAAPSNEQITLKLNPKLGSWNEFGFNLA